MNELLIFTYKNWKGNVSERTVKNPKFVYGTSPYHEGEQWFIEAFDLDKNDMRMFACVDIIDFKE